MAGGLRIKVTVNEQDWARTQRKLFALSDIARNALGKIKGVELRHILVPIAKFDAKNFARVASKKGADRVAPLSLPALLWSRQTAPQRAPYMTLRQIVNAANRSRVLVDTGGLEREIRRAPYGPDSMVRRAGNHSIIFGFTGRTERLLRKHTKGENAFVGFSQKKHDQRVVKPTRDIRKANPGTDFAYYRLFNWAKQRYGFSGQIAVDVPVRNWIQKIPHSVIAAVMELVEGNLNRIIRGKDRLRKVDINVKKLEANTVASDIDPSEAAALAEVSPQLREIFNLMKEGKITQAEAQRRARRLMGE